MRSAGRFGRAVVLVALLASPAPAQPSTCAGDCDASGRVTVGELVLAVHVCLGRAPALACAAADADRSGSVSIDELLGAVVESLTDCGARPAPTATATFTATIAPTPTSTSTATPSPSPTSTPAATPPVHVGGPWREGEASVVASDCHALVERVRDQLLPLPGRDLHVSQEGARVVFVPAADPEETYEGRADEGGVVSGAIEIAQSQQGCVTRLEARFSYAMGASPADGEYALSWRFSSGCRPLLDCRQTLRSRLTRL
jgi:hypothetical protein